LALLPLPVAAYLWFLINAASIVGAAWLSTTLAKGGEERERRVGKSDASRVALAACALVIVLRFVLDNFNLGQVNALVAALAVAHVYLYTRDKKALSAIALVLAASIKLTPAMLLVYHIAKLRLKFATACVTLLVGVTALSFAPFGASSYEAFHAFVNRTVRNEQGYDFAYAGNQSLRGAVARLTNSAEPTDSREPWDALTLLLAILMLAAAVVAAIRAQSELAGISPFFCCVVLLSPLSWKAHYVALALPLATLLALIRRTSGVRRLLLVITAIASFALFNLTSPRLIGLSAAEWSDSHSLVFSGGVLVFLASLIIVTWEQRVRNASRIAEGRIS